MSPKLHRLWFALAVVALLSGLWVFRYDPGTGGSGLYGTVAVWDRWLQRECIVGFRTANKILCTEDEINSSGRR